MVGVDNNAAVMDIEISAPAETVLSEATAMVVETLPHEQDLYSNDEEKCYSAILQLRSSLIGSNRQKHHVIERGILPRIICLLGDSKTPARLRIACAQTMGSIAKGWESHSKALIDSGAVPVLLQGIMSPPPELIEASLRCLRTVFNHPEAPVQLLYANTSLVPHLLTLMPLSVASQISVCSLLTQACKTREHQNVMAGCGADRAIGTLLKAHCPDVQLVALRLLAFMIFGNESVAERLWESDDNGVSLVNLVVGFLDRHHTSDMQLEAARCLTYLYRCEQLTENDPRLVYKALPCLVRLSRPEETIETRILAAETLTLLIELSGELQRIAAVSNHLIKTIASFLWWEADTSEIKQFLAQDVTESPSKLIAINGSDPKFIHMCLDPAKTTGLTRYQLLQVTRKLEQQACYCRDMRKAAFRVFAALAANDEDIRKRIIDTEELMWSLVAALQGGASTKLQMAAVGCLHSLSRSVQLLRTSFQDFPVWRPLMKILSMSGSDQSSETCVDFMVVASSTLCNLLLEFSPSKEPILESGAIDLLCQLTHKNEPALALNGVWGLMNMAFRADQRIKVQIITTLGSDQIFRLLSDHDINVMMKTLGLLRNLLSNKLDIDHVMTLYGKEVMQAVVFILEGDNVIQVKEQALCILANIADGDSAKSFIMSNEDVLKKIANYIIHTNAKLQMAAVVCVHNLCFAGEQGATERQSKLKDIGVHAILQQLRSSNDNTLAEQAKSVLQEFA